MGKHVYIDEERFGQVLNMPIRAGGTRSISGKFPYKIFVEKIGKVPQLNKIGVPKKIIKGTYQLYFEFVNKNLLP